MKENYIETTQPGTNMFRRVSWGAICAGVIVTVVLQLLFTLLGTGIGAAAIDPLHQSNPGKGLGVGAGIWLLVSTLISIYVGARVAGNLSGATPKSERALHGILTWATTAIASIVFLSSTAGALFGGAASFLGSATAARTQPAYADASQTSLMATGRHYQDAQMSSTEQQAQNEQRVREAGDVAAKRVSQAALLSFFVLLLSGMVAAYGARSGQAGTRAIVGGFRHAHPEPA